MDISQIRTIKMLPHTGMIIVKLFFFLPRHLEIILIRNLMNDLIDSNDRLVVS